MTAHLADLLGLRLGLVRCLRRLQRGLDWRRLVGRSRVGRAGTLCVLLLRPALPHDLADQFELRLCRGIKPGGARAEPLRQSPGLGFVGGFGIGHRSALLVGERAGQFQAPPDGHLGRVIGDAQGGGDFVVIPAQDVIIQ